MDLLDRIHEFIAAVNQMREEANSKGTSEYMRSYYKPLEIRNGRVSGDWLILDSVSGGSRSVYAFIRLTDGANKTLGAMKSGDIHKPATYKAPAKHARGNVFSDDFGASCAGLYGIAYLR